MSATRAEIRLTYRKLYQSALRAVKYTSPDKLIVREKLRHAFRELPAESFDAARIARTVEFLDNAARMKGLETKIVKNLIHIAWGKQRLYYNTKMAQYVMPGCFCGSEWSFDDNLSPGRVLSRRSDYKRTARWTRRLRNSTRAWVSVCDNEFTYQDSSKTGYRYHSKSTTPFAAFTKIPKDSA
jgi:hypothetical protein